MVKRKRINLLLSLVLSIDLFLVFHPQAISLDLFRRIRGGEWREDMPQRYQDVSPVINLSEAGLSDLAQTLGIPAHLPLNEYQHFNRLAEVIFALANAEVPPGDGALKIIKLAVNIFEFPVNPEVDFATFANYKNFMFNLYDQIITTLIYAFQGETEKLPLTVDRNITLVAESQLLKLNAPILNVIEHLYQSEYNGFSLKQSKLVWLSWNRRQEDPVTFLISILDYIRERPRVIMEIPPTTPMEYLMPAVEAAKGLQKRGDERAIPSLAKFNFRRDQHYAISHPAFYNQLFEAVTSALDEIAKRLGLRDLSVFELATYVRRNGSAIVRLGGGKFYKVAGPFSSPSNLESSKIMLIPLSGPIEEMDLATFNQLWDHHIWDEYAEGLSFPHQRPET